MSKMLKILTVLIVFLVCTFGEVKIKYAAVIFRHGDRTPVDTYPTDPWNNESLWPVKFGQLTNLGKKQHYALGQWLRKRYMNFISEDFDPTAVYIRSTDVDRTLMSAQANLAGFFPPTAHSKWNTNLPWQPIPVHTVPEFEDELLAMKRKCTAYSKERSKYLKSEAYKKRLSKYNKLMDYISMYTGRKIRDYEDINSIYSTLKIETSYSFTLPNWTHSVFPDKMREPSCYSFSTSTATPLMARLMIGPLMKQIVQQMLVALWAKPNYLKLSIYSGHDFTIGNILNGLGVYDGNCPEYTSTIFFEVIENDTGTDYYVRLSYRNSTEIIEPHILTIPNCGELCPVLKFLELYEHIITVDWKNECKEKKFPLLQGAYFVVAIFVILIYYVGSIKYSRQELMLIPASISSK